MFNVMRLTAVVILLAGFAKVSQAELLNVLNPSFESPARPDGGFGGVSNWTCYNSSYGVFNPKDVSYPGASGSPGTLPSPADGAQVNFGDWTRQQVGTVVANTRYTLTVAVGWRADYPFTQWLFALSSAANPSVDTTFAKVDNTTGTNPTAGTFADNSCSFVATLEDEGKPLWIYLKDVTHEPGYQINFDNVRLDATVIPEPSTLALLATGLIGLLAYAWRRRK